MWMIEEELAELEETGRLLFISPRSIENWREVIILNGQIHDAGFLLGALSGLFPAPIAVHSSRDS
jgi:hypothetical protein